MCFDIGGIYETSLSAFRSLWSAKRQPTKMPTASLVWSTTSAIAGESYLSTSIGLDATLLLFAPDGVAGSEEILPMLPEGTRRFCRLRHPSWLGLFAKGGPKTGQSARLPRNPSKNSFLSVNYLTLLNGFLRDAARGRADRALNWRMPAKQVSPPVGLGTPCTVIQSCSVMLVIQFGVVRFVGGRQR